MKNKSTLKPILIKLTQDQREWLKLFPNQSAYIRALIDVQRKQQQQLIEDELKQ